MDGYSGKPIYHNSTAHRIFSKHSRIDSKDRNSFLTKDLKISCCSGSYKFKNHKNISLNFKYSDSDNEGPRFIDIEIDIEIESIEM